MHCLVIGATGYVGARLVSLLLDEGHTVRCLVRSRGKAHRLAWSGRAEIVEGDLFDETSLHRALAGVDVVYYLVHSLTQNDFAERDQRAARRTAELAEDARVRRLIYLGGLTPHNTDHVSEHLRSREETGRVFLDSAVPAVVLRASLISGSGSASFEILRHLTERLPVLLLPVWLTHRTQPIAISDVLRYLTECARLPAEINRTFDIGGPDVLSYWKMVQDYAEVAGLAPRVPLPVPALLPGLSAWWIGLVTPVPRALAAPLIESLRHELVCAEHDIDATVPAPPPRLGYRESVRRILEAGSGSAVTNDPAAPLPTDLPGSGGPEFRETHRVRCSGSADLLWRSVESVGGDNGWTSPRFLWQLREKAEELTGGVPADRGRRDPHVLTAGDLVDSWTVASVDPGRELVLHSDMHLPGEAVMELRTEAEQDGSVLELTLRFRPSGLRGHLYWAAVKPLHGPVFGDIARTIVRRAQQEEPAPVEA